ncbi:MAG TPA: hypothetical protein VGI95_21710 [Caulobacteraceae bacterium]
MISKRHLIVLAGATAAASLAEPAGAQISAEPPMSAGEAATTLRDLVGRYLTWRGGAALEQLQTIHERLFVDTPAGRQTGAFWLDRDGRLRRETVDGGVARVEVAGPDGAWRTSADGKIEDDPKGVERARRLALLEFGDAFRGRGGATVALNGKAEIDDHTWSLVRITFGDADTYDAMIDAGSGALGGYQIVEAGVKRSRRLGDWRLVDGVRMPLAQLDQTAAESETRISSVELNRPLDPALFERPKPAA